MILIAAGVTWLSAATLTSGGTSKLWGADGELWDPAGPLPDFSFAGYQRGERPIPDRKAEVSVRDFGAVGDGKTDDTAAFLKAIAESPGKVIGIPEGRFLITDILEIKKSGTVLQGAGADRTVLVCPKPLHEIRPAPIENHAAKTNYSWSGGIVWIAGSSFGRTQIAGIEPGAKRGDKTLTLDESVSGLKKGKEVIVAIKDDSEQSLLKYLYAKQTGDISKLDPGEDERQQVCRVESIDGNLVTLDRPLRFDLLEEFQPELRSYDPRVQECGIERIGFEFPKEPYGGHFSEDGYNAISIQHGVHCWARDILIRNSDSGIFLTGGRFCTVQDVVLESDRRPGPKDNTGHHGLSAGGEDHLMTRFEFRTKFVHDISVERTTGCVFSNGKGIDLNLDHHRRAPYENLFSNLDLGRGERAFSSGGSKGRGHHAAAGNTYWNLKSRERLAWPAEFGPDRLNWVALNTRERKSDNPEKAEGRWLERLRPGAVEPADLHSAQLARRLGKPSTPRKKPATDLVHTWENSEGKKIRATFVRLRGDAVVLKLPSGRITTYPLAKLSASSRKQARELGGE